MPMKVTSTGSLRPRLGMLDYIALAASLGGRGDDRHCRYAANGTVGVRRMAGMVYVMSCSMACYLLCGDVSHMDKRDKEDIMRQKDEVQREFAWERCTLGVCEGSRAIFDYSTQDITIFHTRN